MTILIASPQDLPSEHRPYMPLGAARQLMLCRDPEVLLSGPAGTGKSRASLEKLHLAAMRYPGMRGLIVDNAGNVFCAKVAREVYDYFNSRRIAPATGAKKSLQW